MKVFQFCLVFIDISTSLKILDNISVIISTKNMIRIPLLAFHIVQAFGTLKDFLNLITKENDSVSLNFTKFLRSSEI